MQPSRAGWLAIIVTCNKGAARSGKANRLVSEQELGNENSGGQKEMHTAISHMLSPR